MHALHTGSNPTVPHAKSKSGGNLSSYQVPLACIYAASLLLWVVVLSGDRRGSSHVPTKYHCREPEGHCKANPALQCPPHDQDKNTTGTRTRQACECGDKPVIKVEKIYAFTTGTGNHCLDFGAVLCWSLQGWVTQRRAIGVCLTEHSCPTTPGCWCPGPPWARKPRDAVIFHLHRGRLTAPITLRGLQQSYTSAVFSQRQTSLHLLALSFPAKEVIYACF